MKKKKLFIFRNLLSAILLTGFVTLGGSIQISAQTVTGTVKSLTSDQALAGVTIHVSNTTEGTVTDDNGAYTINNVSSSDTLVFSFLGYSEKRLIVGDQQVINVLLEPVASSLDEIVVVGYGTMKKKDLTGSVSTIDVEKKNIAGDVNIMQSLVGATPGLNVDQTGGAEGSQSFSIRGQNSLSGSNAPLIVLNDAIFHGSLSDINPNDIASVDVLKGASAAAVYGRRAANGVLIINTKKGKTAKPTVSLNANWGFQDMTNNPMRVMNSDEFAERLVNFDWMEKTLEWYKTNPKGPEGRPERVNIDDRETVASFLRTPEEQKNYLAGNDIDWVKEVTQKGPVQNYALSVSGNSDSGLDYYFSGAYSDSKGILKNDRSKKATFYSRLNSKINDWIEIGLDANYSHRDNSGLAASLTDALVASPLVDNHIGSADYDILLGDELYQPYPLVNLYVDNSDISTDLFTIGNLKIDIPGIEGLHYNLRYTRNESRRDNNTYFSRKTSQGQSDNGRADKAPSGETSYILDNIVNYSNSFGNHSLNVTLLYSQERVSGNSTIARSTDFGIDILGYNNLGLGLNPVVSSSAYEEGSLSYMARVNYNYNSRYLVTGTFRRDGFSGFGRTHKWSNFPSVGIAWVPTEEDFLKNSGIYLKVRLSYGANGNQGIGRYASFSTMANRDYVYGSNRAIGIYPNVLGNEDLKWETTDALGLGFDFSFLKERISGSLDLYSSVTSDVLVQRGLPRQSGYSSVWSNLSEIGNKGIELALNSINLHSRNLEWRSSFNFSLNRDKIKVLYGDEKDDIGNAWFIGEPISAIYDYNTLGVWNEQELFDGAVYEDWFPGQFKYEDLNDDGKISPSDRKIIGYKSPSYRFSIDNSVIFKQFSLSILITSIQGGKNRYMENNFENMNHPEDMVFRKNVSAINPYWLPDRQTNNTSALYVTPGPVVGGLYQKRSFVRIQNVSLSYSLPEKASENLGIGSAEFYVSSKNPYIWTQWDGWDPESGLSNVPVMRNFSVGLKLNF